MTIPLARSVNGKKFLWDGIIYESEDQVHKTLESYKRGGFEVQLFVEENKYLVYSRRVAAVQSED